MKPEIETVLHVHDLLLSEYGDHPWHPRDPVVTLVNTVLSQNTNDVNRDRAFERLRERFPTWGAVRDAELTELVEAIRPAGLAPTKAPRIQKALRRITAEQGGITLDFLSDLPLEEARAWLLDLPGVGPGPLPGGREYRTAPKPGVALELKGERKIVFYPSPPAYPKECEKAGIEGDVVLAFEIAPSGDVVKVRVVRMSGCAILDQTAIEYIRKFRFNRASETTQGKVTVRFRFRTGGGG